MAGTGRRIAERVVAWPLVPIFSGLRSWTQVVKLMRCVPMALTTGFGFILCRPLPDASLVMSVAGVFLLACGCSAINSAQEAGLDVLYRRTCNRPVATARVPKSQATTFGFVLMLLGLAVLGREHDAEWLPPLLGLMAVLLYNGVYTPLKQVSVFALLPGGLAGGLPPLIGWTSAGGSLDDPSAWVLVAFFFLWQIPHYCLILLHHRHDYRAVAQPSLIRSISETSLKRITLIWVGAFATVALMLACSRGLLLPSARVTLAVATVLLTIFLGRCLLRPHLVDYRLPILVLNGGFFTNLSVIVVLQLLPQG